MQTCFSAAPAAALVIVVVVLLSLFVTLSFASVVAVALVGAGRLDHVPTVRGLSHAVGNIYIVCGPCPVCFSNVENLSGLIICWFTLDIETPVRPFMSCSRPPPPPSPPRGKPVTSSS